MTEKTVEDFTDQEVVAAYMHVREARSKATAEYERKDAEMKDVLSQFDMELLRRLDSRGNTGIRTNYGDRDVSVYKTEDIKPSAENWPEIYAWVLEDVVSDCLMRAQVPKKYREPVLEALKTSHAERFEIFEKRLKKGTVQEHMEAGATFDDETGHKVLGAPPPGVRVLREYKAQVRLLSASKK